MSRLSGSLEDYAKRLFMGSVRHALPLMPLPVLWALGDLVGSLLIGGKKDVMARELQHIIGPGSAAELDRIIRRASRNFRKDLFEIWTFPSLNRAKVERMTTFSGLEHLDQALEKGRGVILCVAHFGSWKVILPALAYRGYKVNQIAADPMRFVGESESPSHNAILSYERRCEESLPVRFVYVDKSTVHRGLFKALAANEIVVAALDGVLGKDRIEVPLGRTRIRLSPGPLSLAMRTGAELLTEIPVRQSDGPHRITIHPPFDIDRDREDFKVAWLEAFAEVLGAMIKDHPDHYAPFLYSMVKYPVPGLDRILLPAHPATFSSAAQIRSTAK